MSEAKDTERPVSATPVLATPQPASSPLAPRSGEPAVAAPSGRQRWTVATALRCLGPYGLVVLGAAIAHPLLIAPAIATSCLAFFMAERTHPAHPWRFAAGWVLSTGLLVPCLWALTQRSLRPIAVAAGAGCLVAIALRWAPRSILRDWRAQPMFAAVSYLLLAGLLLRWASGPVLFPLNDDVLFALYAAADPPELEQESLDAASRIVLGRLRQYDRRPDRRAPAVVAQGLPEALERTYPGAVYVTLWLDGRAPLRGQASEGVLCADIARATERALDSTGEWSSWVQGASRVRFQIDVTGRPERIRRRPLHPLVLAALSTMAPVSPHLLGKVSLLAQLAYEIEPGVDGLVLRLGEREASLLPSDPVLYGWLTPRVEGRIKMIQRLLAELGHRLGGSDDAWLSSDAKLYKMRATSFGRPLPGVPGRAVRFFRANVPQAPPDADAIAHGIDEAAAWLVRTVRADGSFDYEYFPNANQTSPDYNSTRHAGCVYGLFHYYEFLRSEGRLGPAADATLRAAARSLGWIFARLKPLAGSDAEPLIGLVDANGDAASGATALGVLALVARPDQASVSDRAIGDALFRPDEQQMLRGLGRFLLAMIDRRGKVFASYAASQAASQGATDSAEEPLYSPGEVLLALARLYGQTRDSAWLEGARRIAEQQILRYSVDKARPDHWVMQGLGELYALTGDEHFARWCLRMGDEYVQEQFPPLWSSFPDYAGSYRRDDDVPRTTRACSSSEAMGAVVATAWRLGVDSAPYEQALLKAARHMLEHQWRPENSYFLAQPERARGAIRMGLVDNHCRIDNNQHALIGLHHALVVARELERRRDEAGASER